ncbi:probable RNA-dependent RNA polymerase 5 isoform X3 [Spinacia oleracea]|nr:probable RNA-dependent RNA polymerase 5 isoform X3 [Spinacia oleracea]XP_021848595.2 probable RNA-dependent RNA polymerase 5 isoform X3 [Spinacia oleracea]XP_056692928.1 probable RNA-dependent RNA polymerase 5 isoform X3 [Spinacia oleracea]
MSDNKRKMESDSPGDRSNVRRVWMYNSPIKNEKRLDSPKSEPDSVLDAPDQSTVRRVCIYNSPTRIEEKLDPPKSEPDSVLVTPDQSTVRRVYMYNSPTRIEERLDPLKNEPDSVLLAPDQSTVRRVCIYNSPTRIEKRLDPPKYEPDSVLLAPDQSTVRRVCIYNLPTRIEERLDPPKNEPDSVLLAPDQSTVRRVCMYNSPNRIEERLDPPKNEPGSVLLAPDQSTVRRVCIYNSPTRIEERLDPPKNEPDSVLLAPDQSTVRRVCIYNSPTRIEGRLDLPKSEPGSMSVTPDQSTVRRVCIYNSPARIEERLDLPKSEPGSVLVAPDQSTVRRVCISNSSIKIEERLDPLKSETDRVLDALKRLEFRKAFLLLNYSGRTNLEDVVSTLSADEILSYQRLGCLGMREFEIRIWNDFGRGPRRICHEKERINKMNWDTGERYNYHCHIDSRGNCRFKGPYLNKEATLLQKVAGDENVLVVKFLEEETANLGAELMKNPVFNEVAEHGIFFGRKCYQFFVFKDGGKEGKKKEFSSPVKCYFVCTEGFASILRKPAHELRKMPVPEARGLFMHIHNASSISNYMARFSLILSKTITLDLNFNDVRVEVLEDIPCLDEDGNIVKGNDGKALILTDGTGFISEDLAMKCPHNCINGRVNNEEDIQGSSETCRFQPDFSGLRELKSPSRVPPLLIQFRMFHEGRAIKGTVLVNKKLPPNTIQVRRSMVKVDKPGDDKIPSGAPIVNSFEVVGTSNKPKMASLSKNLIALLHYGGVPKNFFLSLLSEALEKQLAILYKPKAAIRVAVNWDFGGDFIEAKMIASGIPLDEPYLQDRLFDIAKEEMKSLKGGKLFVDGCHYVIGTADPTGILNRGEVCVILLLKAMVSSSFTASPRTMIFLCLSRDDGQVSGPVLVYRNPGTHPGDIHVVNARYVGALKEIVGNSKYGIFFPSKGPRSMADEIAGGDYDGDTYWVSTNFELLEHFKPSEPWKCSTGSPNVNKVAGLPSAGALERDLFRLYLTTRFQSSNAMGIAADSWQVYMDRMLTLGDDCAGEKAALKQKMDELIDIYYDALDAPKKGRKVVVPNRLIPEMYPHHMGRAEHCTYKSKSILGEIYDTVDQFNAPIPFWKIECFNAEIPETHLALWRKHYSTYRSDMQRALNGYGNTAAVYQKYRNELYGGVDALDLSEKDLEEIRLEALAIYHVCYDYADMVGDLKKCGFAWKVAGDALCKIYLRSKSDKPILFAPSVVSQMMR